MDTIISIHNADEFIIALATLIKRLAVDHLHIVGDIFDRGPRADSIMDMLMQHHAVDIQWGNHDIFMDGRFHRTCGMRGNRCKKQVYLTNAWIPWKAVMVSVCVLLLYLLHKLIKIVKLLMKLCTEQLQSFCLK